MELDGHREGWLPIRGARDAHVAQNTIDGSRNPRLTHLHEKSNVISCSDVGARRAIAIVNSVMLGNATDATTHDAVDTEANLHKRGGGDGYAHDDHL